MLKSIEHLNIEFGIYKGYIHKCVVYWGYKSLVTQWAYKGWAMLSPTRDILPSPPFFSMAAAPMSSDDSVLNITCNKTSLVRVTACILWPNIQYNRLLVGWALTVKHVKYQSARSQCLQTSVTPHASASGNWLRMHVTPVNQIALVFCTGTHVWRPGSSPHSGGPRYLGMSTTKTSALVSSEASLIKSATVPTAPFTSPVLVQIFFVNMTLAPMHKQMTLSRPPANFLDALPAFFVRINGNTHTNRLPLGL